MLWKKNRNNFFSSQKIEWKPLFEALQCLELRKNKALRAFIDACPVFIEDGYVNVCEKHRMVFLWVPYPRSMVLASSKHSLDCLEKIASSLYKHYAKEKGWPSKHSVYSKFCAYPKGLFKTNPEFAIEIYVCTEKMINITPLLAYYLERYNQREREEEILSFLIKEGAINKSLRPLISLEDIKSMIIGRLEGREGKECLYCGRIHYKRRKFCSDKCRVYYWRRQKIKEDFKKIKTKRG